MAAKRGQREGARETMVEESNKPIDKVKVMVYLSAFFFI